MMDLATFHCCHICGEILDTAFQLEQHEKREHADFEYPVANAGPSKRGASGYAAKSSTARHYGGNLANLDQYEHSKIKKQPVQQLIDVNLATDEDETLSLADRPEILNEVISGASANAETTEQFLCSECGILFKTARECRRHIVDSHLAPSEQSNKLLSPDGSRFLTNKAPEIYNELKAATAMKNEETEDPANPYSCSICSQKFPAKVDLYEHSSAVHNKRVLYECNVCQKTFAFRLALARHLKMHKTGHSKDSSAIFECPYCAKQFMYSGHLRRHVATHTGESCYTCKFCQEDFKSNAALVLHRACHTGEKRFECDKCGKMCAFKSHLERHMRAHATGPMACEQCGQIFNCYSVLLLHVRDKHPTKRQFQCPKCDRAFFYVGQLERHMLVHSDTKDHKCPICYRAFSMRGSLLSHLEQHLPDDDTRNRIKDKPYECAYCSLRYKYESNLERHMLSAHPSLNLPLPDYIADMLDKEKSGAASEVDEVESISDDEERVEKGQPGEPQASTAAVEEDLALSSSEDELI